MCLLYCEGLEVNRKCNTDVLSYIMDETESFLILDGIPIPDLLASCPHPFIGHDNCNNKFPVPLIPKVLFHLNRRVKAYSLIREKEKFLTSKSSIRNRKVVENGSTTFPNFF